MGRTLRKTLTVPKGYINEGKEIREIITEKEIYNKVKELAAEISKCYAGKIPIIIGVLNGSFMFMADLVRNLSIDFEVDFIKISSYGSSTKSSGTVRLLKDISADITGRDIIVVEDIIDSGLTIEFIKHRLEEAGTKSVKFATCLYKSNVAKQSFDIDFIGFNIPDKFVVGYGLDFDQKFRGLSSIYAFEEEV
ncbi:MAG: hypoxanthine phosphoribosyltransferase [Candidatus Marinimicrobia bacterium]|nr:hypoxanthine phosphoribosyltransferase [Candidatus Neomarinimicrobiota bacterium]MBL7022736.1 hypoxanthine phosphoribosyltransferase [Candidatus Neomarinimicrobiota bacterium]MBL7109135.1 hypoxanthine phosphoribosyltransferase [Candidatus Neomarinimicrobiota bacterium]